jgi:hypothetical protein
LSDFITTFAMHLKAWMVKSTKWEGSKDKYCHVLFWFLPTLKAEEANLW